MHGSDNSPLLGDEQPGLFPLGTLPNSPRNHILSMCRPADHSGFAIVAVQIRQSCCRFRLAHFSQRNILAQCPLPCVLVWPALRSRPEAGLIDNKVRGVHCNFSNGLHFLLYSSVASFRQFVSIWMAELSPAADREWEIVGPTRCSNPRWHRE